MHWRGFAALVGLSLLGGCGESPASAGDDPTPSQGSGGLGGKADSAFDGAAPDGSVPDGSAPDAGGSDGGPRGTADAGPTAPRSTCPLETDLGECRPLSVVDAMPVVENRGVCMPGFTFEDGADLVSIVAAYNEGQMLAARISNKTQPLPPQALPWQPATDVTGAVTSQGVFLYFVGAAGAQTALYQVQLDGTNPPTPVTLLGGPQQPYWPQAAPLADGRVLLGCVRSQTDAFVGVGMGNSFTMNPAPTAPPPVKGILAHVGTTQAGKWVLTTQQSNADFTAFTSFVSLGSEGGAWSTPQNLAPEAGNVHDAYPIQRLDSGADLYYLRPDPSTGSFFSVYRRYLSEDGQLGEPQRVTDDSLGHVEKPQARRLSSGRVSLTFARRITPQRYDVAVAVLAGDAPR